MQAPEEQKTSLSIKKLITYYNKGATSSGQPTIGGDNMRMSVWDMDSEEEDMGSSDENEAAQDAEVEEVADVEAKAEKETDEMVN